MIRVLLVDDHALFRSGLISVLSGAPDIEVFGDVASGEDALELLSHGCSDAVLPDVVLMDVNMPGMGGIETTRKIARRWSEIKVIAVTALSDDPFPARLLDAGADGFISKGCAADDVFEAIRAVTSGRQYLSADIAQKLALGRMVSGGQQSALGMLSPREMQVMMMLVQGQGTQAICDALFLSPKTISTYRHRLYDKLGVSNDVELTHYALRHELI